MSFEAVLDTDEAVQVASNTGWFDATDWFETLDMDDYPEIAHLNEHGWNEPSAKVADELDAALESEPPDDDVADTVRGLVKFIRAGDPDAVLVITQGMGEGEEDKE